MIKEIQEYLLEEFGYGIEYNGGGTIPLAYAEIDIGGEENVPIQVNIDLIGYKLIEELYYTSGTVYNIYQYDNLEDMEENVILDFGWLTQWQDDREDRLVSSKVYRG